MPVRFVRVGVAAIAVGSTLGGTDALQGGCVKDREAAASPSGIIVVRAIVRGNHVGVSAKHHQVGDGVVLDEVCEFGFEFLRVVLKGFVVPEECEDDVCLDMGQIEVGAGKAFFPWPVGHFVAGEPEVANDEYFPVKKYDKVLFHPKHAIPVDFEPDNVLFVVPIEDVVAVFRRSPKPQSAKKRPRRGIDDLSGLSDSDDATE